MHMPNRRFNKILAVLFFFVAACLPVLAQDGAYSAYTPYSIYAIGDLAQPGTAYNKSMGGVGVATRNPRYINVLNPAAVTARDSLSFMADYSLAVNNTYFRQGDATGANTRANVTNLALSFPIYRSSAAMFGISPLSSTGYMITAFNDDPLTVSNTGYVVDGWTGQGSIYQAFGAVGATFWKRFSVGIQGIQYFGKIEKEYTRAFGKSNYLGVESGQRLTLRGTAVKAGVQYEQPLGNNGLVLGLGATYKNSPKMRGFAESYVDTLTVSDTIRLQEGAARFAGEVAVGFSLRSRERWRLEVNYAFSDWRSCGMDVTPGLAAKSTLGKSFSASRQESLRAGFEIIPNANDIRYYYRRLAYRVGAYWEKSYFALDGNRLDAFGLTIGATLPVFRLSNGLTFALDVGQRGSLAGNLTRERYINFSIGFNAYDLWFQKPRYN